MDLTAIHNRIDINADVGEGMNNEELLFPFLSSCNIACGGHKGDETSMRHMVQLADKYRLKVGAHPSYPDKENFGRKEMNISCAALFKSLKSQLETLIRILEQEHMQLHHIKTHGALYNKAFYDKQTAEIIIEVVKSIPMPVSLYLPYGSVISKMAIEQNIPVTYEGFADRNYTHDLQLVSRSHPEALITDVDEMMTHVMRMIKDSQVKTISGDVKQIFVDTICVHGDTPRAVEMVKQLNSYLIEEGIKIR